MFTVQTHWFQGALIEGCPPAGLPALDFRRNAGLPEGTTNFLRLGDFQVTDEALCRRLSAAYPKLADEGANWHIHLTMNDMGKSLVWHPTLPISECHALLARDPEAWFRLIERNILEKRELRARRAREAQEAERARAAQEAERAWAAEREVLDLWRAGRLYIQTGCGIKKLPCA